MRHTRGIVSALPDSLVELIDREVRRARVTERGKRARPEPLLAQRIAAALVEHDAEVHSALEAARRRLAIIEELPPLLPRREAVA